MAEYIERDMLLKMISHKPSSPITDREDRLIDGFISAVKNCPAADVRKVKHGEWKYEERELRTGIISCFHTCSACGYHTNLFVIKSISSHPYYYCPNCGADMRPEPPQEE